MDQKKARKQLPQTTSLSDLTESLTMGLTLEGVAKKAQLLGARDSVPVPIFQGHDQKLRIISSAKGEIEKRPSVEAIWLPCK